MLVRVCSTCWGTFILHPLLLIVIRAAHAVQAVPYKAVSLLSRPRGALQLSAFEESALAEHLWHLHAWFEMYSYNTVANCQKSQTQDKLAILMLCLHVSCYHGLFPLGSCPARCVALPVAYRLAANTMTSLAMGLRLRQLLWQHLRR